MQHDNLNTIMSRRMSDPTSADKRDVSPLDTITRAHTEGMLHTAFDNPDMKLRIGEWLLDYVKNNTVERTMYFNILAAVGIQTSDINSLEYWPLDSTDQSTETIDGPPSPADLDQQAYNSSPLQHSDQRLEMPSFPQSKANAIPDIKLIKSSDTSGVRLFPEGFTTQLMQLAHDTLNESSPDIVRVKSNNLGLQADLLGLIDPPLHVASSLRNGQEAADCAYNDDSTTNTVDLGDSTQLTHNGPIEAFSALHLSESLILHCMGEKPNLDESTSPDCKDVRSYFQGILTSAGVRKVPSFRVDPDQPLNQLASIRSYVRPVAPTASRPLSAGPNSFLARQTGSLRCAPSLYRGRSKSMSFFYYNELT
jgi:hypothetical protein